ncbi:MAG TPA: 2-octaprenyl-6-methoxyphenyl hydroxylase [Gammaproteobacteria bacterium]|nr:2-octaprenyl-6-methoxyphenyl hydroxylase [Gammaproteobacteria bacterium]
MSARPGDALRCDVLIVGGGAVGSALACALAELPLDVVLVEARETAKLEQPSFDGRTTALANASQRILAALGIWPELAPRAEPIRTVHVSERGRFGAARIEAEHEGVEALGYTVENAVLGRALWERLDRAPRLQVLAPATVAELRTDADAAEAHVEPGARVLRARLVVGADGARSSVRAALGVAAAEHDYEQRALIFNVTTEAPLAGRAFERFTKRGALAFLPLTGSRAAVIWTLPSEDAERALTLPTEEFRAQLQATFGFRLGRIARIGERRAHSLARVASEELTRERALLIGDAALRLHPIAAQGFNLALRDVATLAEVLADEIAAARERGAEPDPGSAEVLERYRAWRAADRGRVSAFTHGLVSLFGESTPGVGTVRGLGLVAFDLLPGAKALLARQTMGRGGRVPRLARGLRLVE